MFCLFCFTLNILKTEKILQFWNEKFATYTSFKRKRLRCALNKEVRFYFDQWQIKLPLFHNVVPRGIYTSHFAGGRCEIRDSIRCTHNHSLSWNCFTLNVGKFLKTYRNDKSLSSTSCRDSNSRKCSKRVFRLTHYDTPSSTTRYYTRLAYISLTYAPRKKIIDSVWKIRDSQSKKGINRDNNVTQLIYKYNTK